MIWLMLTGLGIGAGVLSGIAGIGGGVIIVPALALLFGFTQKMAQGTTLALLVLPIGILAALTYYKQGDVNLPAAGFIAAGFVIGSIIGARYAVHLSNTTLTRIFAVCLIAIGIRMLFSVKN